MPVSTPPQGSGKWRWSCYAVDVDWQDEEASCTPENPHNPNFCTWVPDHGH